MPISALPTPPSRSDSPQDFSDRADALLGALPGFVTEANALQSDVNAKEASASSHATIATNKAAEAQASATTASTKSSEAAAYAVAAAAAASNAEIAFDSFDDKYLGSKASDPTTDNDGNALLVGALYWNTSVGAVRVWNGAAWLSMAADASIVDFQQAGAGAVVRTAQDKMRELVSVTDYGAMADGVTDNTAAITALFSSLGASYSGVIKIPYGVKYNFNTVAPLAPVRATIVDESLINAWNSSGFRQKVIGVWEAGDPTGVADTNPVISSGHNAVQWLENRGTSGSVSGDARISSVGWSSGRFQQGEPGIRSMAKVEWKQSSFRSSLWDWQLRKYATWEARDYEIWASGKSFTTGDYTITSGRTYVAASTGVAGATEPTWTSGTSSDGGVDWTYVETAQDSYIWGVDEHGRMSTNSSTAGGYTYRFKQSPQDTESLLVAFEGTGASKTVSLHLNGTNAGGTLQSGPFLRGSTAGALELFNSAGTIRLFTADADSFDIGPLGRREATAADGDTTPTVAGTGALVVSNTGATSITTLDDGASTQEVMLIFTNGNTTLVHSTTFRLRGAVNVTPATSGTNPFPTIVMKKYTGSSAWFEVSRNF